MEAHKFDPNTGEDEMSFAQLAVSPPTAPADRDPNNPTTWGKVGRNENCPCGSGKKFKHCHGRFLVPSLMVRSALLRASRIPQVGYIRLAHMIADLG